MSTEEDAQLAEDMAALEGAVPAPREPGRHTYLAEDTTDIRASIGEVWALLADVEGYAAWNPYLVRAEGELFVGSILSADIKMGNDVLHIDQQVLAADVGVRLCMRDHALTALFVYGQRCRWLEVRPDGTTRLRAQDMMDGPLAPLAGLLYGRRMRDAVTAEAAATRAVLERGD